MGPVNLGGGGPAIPPVNWAVTMTNGLWEEASVIWLVEECKGEFICR